MNELSPSRLSANARKARRAAPVARKAEAMQDPVDLRDRYYSPTLQVLRGAMLPDTALPVLDQGSEGGCTGFALATTIHMFRQHRARRELALLGKKPPAAEIARLAAETAQVSPRMLYEMARLHDELPEDGKEGSTLRGALKGFYHNGVCSEQLAPWIPGDKWDLDILRSKDARKISLGAYYRLRPLMSEYHAALSETGAIIVSAKVHQGWFEPNLDFDNSIPPAKRAEKQGVITKRETSPDGHAFAIVGYDQAGFLIQNSWGDDWGGFAGREGIAHWSYDDWAENIMDAWVLQLGVPTPEAFHLTHTLVRPNYTIKESGGSASQARRQDVIGHLIHLDDGKLVEKGRYGTPRKSLQETGDYLACKQDLADRAPTADGSPPKLATEKYDHILFFAHGSLAGAEVGARRTAVMRDVFKRNRIYPIHIMWETGLTDTVLEALETIYKRARDRVGERPEELDRVIESMARGLGTKVWRAIKADARRAFAKRSDSDPAAGTGYRAITTITDAVSDLPRLDRYQIHFAGHSGGSILVGEFLLRWMSENKDAQVQNCFLMAPACSLDFYSSHFLPFLKDNRLRRIVQYGLTEALEAADSQGHYGKSMLNLASRAFEDRPGTPLLGLEKSQKTRKWRDMRPRRGHDIYLSGTDRRRPETNAKSHNGFASDLATLNHMLRTILDGEGDPKLEFTAADLVGL